MPLLLELFPPAFPARGSSLSSLLVFLLQPGQSCLRDGIVWIVCLLRGGICAVTASGVPSLSPLGSSGGFGGREMSWGGVEGGEKPHCG